MSLSCLVCTLGTEAQVVTLALEALTRRGEQVDEVVVVHTAGQDDRIAEAVRRLDEVFAHEPRLAPWRDGYRRRMIQSPSGPVVDLAGAEAVSATLTSL